MSKRDHAFHTKNSSVYEVKRALEGIKAARAGLKTAQEALTALLAAKKHVEAAKTIATGQGTVRPLPKQFMAKIDKGITLLEKLAEELQAVPVTKAEKEQKKVERYRKKKAKSREAK